MVAVCFIVFFVGDIGEMFDERWLVGVIITDE